MNHHAMISRLARADHVILTLNLLLLMLVALLPFATSLLAKFLREGRAHHLAAGVYAARRAGLAICAAVAIFYALPVSRAD